MSGVESQLQTGDKLFTLHQREIRPSFLFASALLCQVDKQFKLNHFLINIHRYNFLYFNTIDLLLLKKMDSVMQKDAEYSDSHFDFNTSDKRTVRVAVKKYEKTGSYISFKLFKRENTSSEYTFAQRITLSADEFQKLIEKLPKAKRMLNSVSSETNDVKDSQPQPKKRRVDIVSVPEN